MKTALDADCQATNVPVDDHRVYTISRTTRVHEVDKYGHQAGYRKPDGEGSGYIRKLYSVTRLEQRDEGVYIELETVELPVIYVFTHDSIGVGEDGPTHQPIEQLAHMRSMPGLVMIRPADANDVREAWNVILQLHHAPAVLVLTRQAVPTIDRTMYAPASGLSRGAYILADAPNGVPDVILIGTGSEVALCLEASDQLTKEGIGARGWSACRFGNYSTIRTRVTGTLFCRRK